MDAPRPDARLPTAKTLGVPGAADDQDGRSRAVARAGAVRRGRTHLLCLTCPGRKRTPDQERRAAVADYFDLARQILKECRIDPGRGEVLSHAWLIARENQTLLETQTDPLPGEPGVASETPSRISTPEVFQVDNSTTGRSSTC